MTSQPSAPPIRGVIFDFHSTLAHGGGSDRWIDAAWDSLGRSGRPVDTLGAATHDALAGFLDQIWEHARRIDPDNDRDSDAERHWTVFEATVRQAPGIDRELGEALYAQMPGRWQAYDDAIPVLTGLREQGVKVAILSNVGFDLRPALARMELDRLADALVLSCEVGVVKPDPAIFRRALDALDVPPHEALMVGDSWRDDGAAAAIGIRTLILPSTPGPVHGLDAVLRLIG